MPHRKQGIYRKEHESKHRTWLSNMGTVCFHVGLESNLFQNLELFECHFGTQKVTDLGNMLEFRFRDEGCWIGKVYGHIPNARAWNSCGLKHFELGTLILNWRHSNSSLTAVVGNHTGRHPPPHKMNPGGVHWRELHRVPSKARSIFWPEGSQKKPSSPKCSSHRFVPACCRVQDAF